MAAYDYGEDLADANEMIEEFGQAGFIRRKGATTGPAHNQTSGPPTNTPVTFVMVDYKNHEIDGTRILTTDRKVLLAVGTMTQDPTPADELVLADGTPQKIINVSPLAPGGVTLLYEMQCRR